MIVSFRNQGSEDIFDGNDSKEARKTCPKNLWSICRRKLDQLNAASSLNDMKIPPGNKLEALKRDSVGQYSIRINDQYRIWFMWTEKGPKLVEIVDYQ